MGFAYYQSFNYSYVGIEIRGTIGKQTTYRFSKGYQYMYPYTIPVDPQTPDQLRIRDLLRKAVQRWHVLPNDDKQYFIDLKLYDPPMSGFNFFVGNYIKTYI